MGTQTGAYVRCCCRWKINLLSRCAVPFIPFLCEFSEAPQGCTKTDDSPKSACKMIPLYWASDTTDFTCQEDILSPFPESLLFTEHLCRNTGTVLFYPPAPTNPQKSTVRSRWLSLDVKMPVKILTSWARRHSPMAKVLSLPRP